MGSGQTKDGFVDIFLQTSQNIFAPGSYVDGSIYINCKDSRNYRLLQLRLKGVEYVHWSQGSGKNRRSYTNTKQTYNADFDIAVFPQGVFPGGHYAFPFRFILPSELTGSHFQSEQCYIRYQLVAQLIPSDDKNDIQTFVKNLNILEPVREVTGMIQKEQLTNPQCCGCCADYGMVKVTMTCDKNFVRSGDTIQVTGRVDNSGGKEDLENGHVSFQDIRWKVSSGGAVRKHVLADHPLFVIQGPVPKGQTKEFSFTATIPQGLMFSTAIGSILSRYQVLNFSSNMGCCSNSPTCEFLLVFHSSTHRGQIGPNITPPPGWMPVTANEVLYTNFPPFHYQPTPGIPYINRAGTTNITQLSAMDNQMGYYQNGIMDVNGYNNTTTAQVF